MEYNNCKCLFICLIYTFDALQKTLCMNSVNKRVSLTKFQPYLIFYATCSVCQSVTVFTFEFLSFLCFSNGHSAVFNIQ
jgi:hypothetical protein